MTDDELLDELVDKWDEHYAQGRDIPPEELCPADRPDLLPELADRIARLKQMAWLGRVAPEDSPFLSSSPPVTNREPGCAPLEGYALLKRRGGGAFGEVWEASGPAGRRAIKFLNGDITATGEAGVRARAEMRGLELMKGIRHPYIIRLVETHLVGNELLIVSELADDELGEWVRRKWGRMPPEQLAGECLTLLRTAVAALDDIWLEHRLQHGDVKPPNILVSGEVSKLGDFGTVTRLEEKGGEDADRVILCDPTGQVHRYAAASQVPWDAALGPGATLYTAAGAFTPRYAPPEAFEGKTSPSFDQYSLALTFCELVYDRLPFSEGDDHREKRRRGEMDLDFLPPPLRPVLARALSPQPQRRFPSCTEFWQALSDGYRQLRAPETSGPGEPVTAHDDWGDDPPGSIRESFFGMQSALDEDVLNRLISGACHHFQLLADEMLRSFPRLCGELETRELFHQSLLKFRKALETWTLDSTNSPKGFLNFAARVMRNHLIDLARRLQKPPESAPPGPRLTRPGPGDSPAGERSSGAEWEKFHRAVASLPDEEREVFELLWYAGLTQAQAAEVLGVAVRTVKRRWQRARLALRGDEPPPT